MVSRFVRQIDKTLDTALDIGEGALRTRSIEVGLTEQANAELQCTERPTPLVRGHPSELLQAFRLVGDCSVLYKPTKPLDRRLR